MDKKSVLEQALLEAQQLEEAVKSNAKEILASTMKQEIEELVKESLNEQEEELDFDELENEDLEDEVGGLPDEEEAMVSVVIDADEPLDLTTASDDEVLKVFKAMGAEDGIVVTQDDNVIDMEDQEAGTEYKIELAENKLKNYPLVKEGIGDLNEDEMDIEAETEITPGDEGDLEEALYEIELDETEGEYGFTSHLGDSDQGYLDREAEKEGGLHGAHPGKGQMSPRTRAKMARGTRAHDLGEDEQGYNARLDDSLGSKKETNERQSFASRRHESEGTEEYYGKPKFSGNRASEQNEGQGYNARLDDSLGSKKEANEDQNLEDRRHESEGEEEALGNPKFSGNKESEQNEASRTLGLGRKFDGYHKPSGIRKGITNNRNLGKINEIVEISKRLQVENRSYRVKNKEYREALKVFRNKLNEVAVFNANLAYSTKLFTEHTTTKKEKINILRRFDNVKTLNESKSLYTQISSDLGIQTKSLKESVQKTITKTPSKGSSINLIETKAYENPQISRMKEIMSKL